MVVLYVQHLATPFRRAPSQRFTAGKLGCLGHGLLKMNSYVLDLAVDSPGGFPCGRFACSENIRLCSFFRFGLISSDTLRLSEWWCNSLQPSGQFVDSTDAEKDQNFQEMIEADGNSWDMLGHVEPMRSVSTLRLFKMEMIPILPLNRCLLFELWPKRKKIKKQGCRGCSTLDKWEMHHPAVLPQSPILKALAVSNLSLFLRRDVPESRQAPPSTIFHHPYTSYFIISSMFHTPFVAQSRRSESLDLWLSVPLWPNIPYPWKRFGDCPCPQCAALPSKMFSWKQIWKLVPFCRQRWSWRIKSLKTHQSVATWLICVESLGHGVLG